MPIWKRRMFESRPITRVEIAPGFGRWWFTYAMPLVSGFFVVLFVGLALSDWMPHFFGVGAINPENLRLVSAIVFVVTYVLHVRAIRRWFRTQDSEFIE